jgi:hypothetical protein
LKKKERATKEIKETTKRKHDKKGNIKSVKIKERKEHPINKHQRVKI